MGQAKATVPTIGDAAVRARTGRTWREWFTLLEKAGAATLDHRAIVTLLRDRYGLEPWWQQMVAVAYEQARGRRRKYQTPTGYQVGGTRTIAAPLLALYEAWADGKKRRQWLPDGLTIRTATRWRSMRIVWGDGASRLDVTFDTVDERRSRVTVYHGGLRTARDATRMKAYWKQRLDALRALLEQLP